MLNTSFAPTIMCHMAEVLKYFMFSASMKSLIPFIKLMRKFWVQIQDQTGGWGWKWELKINDGSFSSEAVMMLC
jgi:hypothetical protein